MTISVIGEPVYELRCDWCDVKLSCHNPPRGWVTFDAGALVRADLAPQGLTGYHLHWCPKCASKILELRTSTKPIGPG